MPYKPCCELSNEGPSVSDTYGELLVEDTCCLVPFLADQGCRAYQVLLLQVLEDVYKQACWELERDLLFLQANKQYSFNSPSTQPCKQ